MLRVLSALLLYITPCPYFRLSKSCPFLGFCSRRGLPRRCSTPRKSQGESMRCATEGRVARHACPNRLTPVRPIAGSSYSRTREATNARHLPCETPPVAHLARPQPPTARPLSALATHHCRSTRQGPKTRPLERRLLRGLHRYRLSWLRWRRRPSPRTRLGRL